MRKAIFVIFASFLVSLLASVSAKAQVSTVTCEYWMGSTLSNPSDLVATPNILGMPTSTIVLSGSFLGPMNIQGPFVSRCTTKLVVPITGLYTFWIAANKIATLWISPTTNFVGQSYLCRVSAAFPTPAAQQWTRNAEQKSAQISLIAGGAYYLRTVQVEDADKINHLSVGWQLPGATYERPISSSRLFSVVPSYDFVPPVVAFSNITNGQVLWNTVTLGATATDNVGVVGVQFGVDGLGLGSEILAGPYSQILNTKTLTDGAHNLSVVARDAAVNVTVASVAVTIDNTTVYNPKKVVFAPSSSHNAVGPNGPLVTYYQLQFFYAAGGSPFMTVNMGKPTVQADGNILVVFTTLGSYLPLQAGKFYVRVVVVGPTASATSLPSDVFGIW